MGNLYVTSDLHITQRGNADVLDGVRGESGDDWLLVAGDIAEHVPVVIDALGRLRERFARVVWVPGNHELWTTPRDPVQLRGQRRYDELVRRCRRIGVDTPEDEFPVWDDGVIARTIVPLFLLYDYSWRTAETEGLPLAAALARAREARVVCTDEFMLHPDPHRSRYEWCEQRLRVTRQRLDALPADSRTILLSHWPLHRHVTERLWYPEFAMWCGTSETADWHVRYRADICVYGHLHIPRTTHRDGVRFEEVSVGYPREWRRRDGGAVPVRRLL